MSYRKRQHQSRNRGTKRSVRYDSKTNYAVCRECGDPCDDEICEKCQKEEE